MKGPILEIMPPPSSGLSAEDEKVLKNWEREIHGLVFKTLHVLAKIKEYKGGRLWKARGHESFAEYVQAQFGHSAAHAGRLDKAGSFVHLLEEKRSSAPLPLRESQIRPVVQALPENHWIPCWEEITDRREPEILQASLIVAEVKQYKKQHKRELGGSNDKGRKSAKQMMSPVERAREVSNGLVEKLMESTKKLPQAKVIQKQLKGIEKLIDRKN